MATRRLLDEPDLLASDVVANSLMNRERGLRGANSYTKALGVDPLDLLVERARQHPERPATWLDVCCGAGRALLDAADIATSDHPDVELRFVGLDLVDLYDPRHLDRAAVELVCHPLLDWDPGEPVDLITCVHGLHYVGDKLGALVRLASWLERDGLLLADVDPTSILVEDGRPAGRRLASSLRQAGFDVQTRARRIRRNGGGSVTLPYRYLGADDRAGPNSTGQPAVHSYYERAGSDRPR